MPDDFPHSEAYLARQAARQKDIEKLIERATWSDAQFIAERDNEYVVMERSYISPRIESIKRNIEEDNDIEGYMKKYHTEEG